jgi:c-di-GMP-binding flagellar brake protein YcgR
MLDRRNSARLPLPLKVRELNGDYMFTWDAADLSEEGIFLVNKVCFSNQDHYSKLSLSLPNGTQLTNVTARIVRENRRGRSGCAFEFLNLSEDHRIELKRFLLERAAS